MQHLLSNECKLIPGGFEFNAYIQSGALLGFCSGVIYGLQGPMVGAALVFKPFEMTFYGLVGAGMGAGIGFCAGLVGTVVEQGWDYIPPIPVVSFPF